MEERSFSAVAWAGVVFGGLAFDWARHRLPDGVSGGQAQEPWTEAREPWSGPHGPLLRNRACGFVLSAIPSFWLSAEKACTPSPLPLIWTARRSASSTPRRHAESEPLRGASRAGRQSGLPAMRDRLRTTLPKRRRQKWERARGGGATTPFYWQTRRGLAMETAPAVSGSSPKQRPSSASGKSRASPSASQHVRAGKEEPKAPGVSSCWIMLPVAGNEAGPPPLAERRGDRCPLR